MNVPDAPNSPPERPDAPLNPSAPQLGASESEEDDTAPSTASNRSFLLTITRTVVATVVGLVALFYGGCALALLAYNFVDPWTTGVQFQRRLEAEATYEKHYEPRPLSALDPDLPLAVVAAEDTRFFQHTGIDWKAIGEAIEENRDGDAQRRGGSSITQQLVKNLFLTTHSTYFRKALELPLTYMAELLLSKRRILELYLNVIEWGPGIYGAEAAAQYHYGQSAAHLTRAQAAALAACIPNPRVRRPQTIGWYRDVILSRMDVLGRLPLAPSPAPSSTDRRSSPPSPEQDAGRSASPSLTQSSGDSASTDSLPTDSTLLDLSRGDSVAGSAPPAAPATLRADSIDSR